jgi:hypothetical protein
MGSQAQVWFRACLFFPSLPTATTRFFTSLQSGTGAGKFSINTSGKIFVQSSSATATTGATTIPVGQWFRIEGFIIGSATVGQTEVKLFTTPFATAPAEVNTSAANLNTLGALNSYTFGTGVGAVNQGPLYLDDIGLSNVSYIGPSRARSASPVAALIAAGIA